MVWILGGFALIALIDFAPLLRRRNKHAMAAFLVLFAMALALSVLQVLHVAVPSSMLVLDKLLKSIGLAYVIQ